VIARVAAASIALAAAMPSPASSLSASSAMSFDELRALVEAKDGPAEIEVPAGVVHGDLVIRRALVLRGAEGAVLEGTGTGTTLAIEANDVVVEGFRVRRSGRKHTTEDAGIKAKGERVRIADVVVEDALFGISLQACRACRVERARVVGFGDDTELRGDAIKLWESHGSHVEHCTVERSRDVVVWYTREAVLDGNVVRHSRYGSHFMYAHDAVVKNSRFEGNVVGLFVMYSMRLTIEDNVLAGARGAAGVGLGFKDSDAVTVRGNWLVANTTGAYFDNTPRTPTEAVTLERNTIALNDVGLRLHGAEKGLHLSGNELRDNAALIEVDGGGDALSVDVRGNAFSDYEGYDLDRNGTGDVPYEVKALSSELTETVPALKFFRGTPAMGLIDAVAHAVPVLSSRRLLVDPEPRMEARR
jgi:nitrous oxidase accessory protein